MKNILKFRTNAIILMGAFVSLISVLVQAEDLYGSFPARFNLTSLNGHNGFAINGINSDDGSGVYVSEAGDVNGDGIGDFLMGSVTSGGYVVFGSKEIWPEKFDLDNLNGNNGFAVNTVNPNDGSGLTVGRAGDVNGDGIDDIVIGTLLSGKLVENQGQSYIIFGSKERWPAKFNLADLNGDNGFVIKLINSNNTVMIFVSGAGDINGDGIDDILVGPVYDGIQQCQSYVVFGSKEAWPAVINLADLNGNNGFILDAINPKDAGFYVSKGGDINSDGMDDILISIFYSEGLGQSYIVFGSKQPWPKNFSLKNLNGKNGFAIIGIQPSGDGYSVSEAGDVNGDGIDDILIGASRVGSGKGQSYVVFGSKKAWPAVINLVALNGNNGFAINGIASADGSGHSVTGTGDINGDGLNDFLIAAPYANKNMGQSYAVFGRKEWTAIFNLTCLNGNNGFILNGINPNDLSGASVSGAGDVNGDGIDDFLIGAPFAHNNTGQGYIIFGRNAHR